MKIEAGKKYKTRNGKDVRIYETYKNEIHGAIYSVDKWTIASFLSCGKRFVNHQSNGISIVIIGEGEDDIVSEVL